MTGERRHDARGRDARGHEGHEHWGHEEALRHVPGAAKPAVFAACAGLCFDPPARTDQVEDAVVRFAAALSEGLAVAGCTLVGHIKGTIAADDQGDLAFHSTVLGAPATLTGGFVRGIDSATLTINVIVFGVDEASLPAVVTGAWSRASNTETTWRG